MNKNFTIADKGCNQGSQNEGCWLEIFQLLIEIRKAITFTSPRVNCGEINEVTPKCQIDFFNKTCKKGLYRTSEHHHRILHIRNSLGNKFKLKLTILSFWTKYTQKGYF